MHHVRSQILTCLWQDGWHMVILTDAVILLQFVDESSRGAPKDWPSHKWVPSNLGCGCSTSHVFFLLVGSAMAVCLSYSNGPSSVQRQKVGVKKEKLRVFLSRITLQLSPTYNIPDLSLRLRLQSQAFPRATLTSVEASERKFPHGLWAAEPHFLSSFFGGKKTPKVSHNN